MLPFWTAFLIRIYAWVTILQREGPLNHSADRPCASSTNRYRSSRATPRSISASSILICRSWYCRFTRSCRKWTTACLKPPPISAVALEDVLAGDISAGAAGIDCRCARLFIPIVGEFVIPDLLGNSRTQMIGQTLWTEFFANRDWPVASALALVLLCALLTPIMIVQRMQNKALGSAAMTAHKGASRFNIAAIGSVLRSSICRSRSWSCIRSTIRARWRSGAAGHCAGSANFFTTARCWKRPGPACASRFFGDGGHHPRHARRGRADAHRPFPRAASFFPHMSMRRWSCPK